MIITVLLKSLCQAPSTVLAPLDGDLQHFIALRSDQIILRLIRSILDRCINTISGELCRNKCFSGDAYMP